MGNLNNRLARLEAVQKPLASTPYAVEVHAGGTVEEALERAGLGRRGVVVVPAPITDMAEWARIAASGAGQ